MPQIRLPDTDYKVVGMDETSYSLQNPLDEDDTRLIHKDYCDECEEELQEGDMVRLTYYWGGLDYKPRLIPL